MLGSFILAYTMNCYAILPRGGYVFDTGHPCCVQLTPVKTRCNVFAGQYHMTIRAHPPPMFFGS